MNRFLIIAFLLLPICLFSQTYTTPVRVNLDKSLGADRSPIMKLDHNGNIFISWVKADGNGNGGLMMGISTDGGMTFSNHAVSMDANCNSNFQRGGEFIVNTKGHIHMVWVSSRLGSMQPDVWYVRSTDMGTTWTTPVSLDGADDSSKYAQDFPSIACDSNDNLYVSFIDARESQRKRATNNQLFFTRSTDGGMNWTVPKRADMPPGGMGGTCECCSEHIAVTKDGHIYIAYRSNIMNLRDIWLARSYDKGETFQPTLKLSSGDWNIMACPVTGPNLTLDDSEGVHIVWRDARDNSDGPHLYYAFVPNGSLVTPMNMKFDASGSQLPNYPTVSLYGKYKAITYETQNYGMRYILNTDNTPLVNNRPISANGSSSKYYANVLFTSDGTRYLSWQDNIVDGGDIYFMKETSSLTAAPAPGNATLLSPANNSMGLSQPVTLTWNPAANATSYHLQIATVNTFTSTVLDSSDITGTSAIISGLKNSMQYHWRVNASNETGTSAWSPHWAFTTASAASVADISENAFRIYPNPVSKESSIHIERSSSSPAILRIVDQLGREIMKTNLTKENTVRLPNISAGSYYFIMEKGAKIEQKIIIVE
jgi:hypothetical protein